MAECHKVCLDEEVIEEGRFQEVGAGRGDYAYAAQHVGANQGNLVKIEAKKGYRCNNFCQVCLCLAVLALFIGLLLWLATAQVFGFGKGARGEMDVEGGEVQNGFDCNEGFHDWERKWNLAKKQFCCQHRGRGCEPGSFHCSGSPDTWNMDHRAKCCDEGVKEACGPVAHPFNCHAGVSNWQHGWSFGKKKYCCDKFKVGCVGAPGHAPPHPPVHPPVHPPMHHPPMHHPPVVHHVVHHVVHRVHPLHHHVPVPAPQAPHGHMAVPVPAPVPFNYNTHMVVQHRDVPYHCEMGVAHWTTMWSTHKKAYCCSKHSVFCGGAGYGTQYAADHGSHYAGHYGHGTYYTESPQIIQGGTYHGHAGYGYYTHGYSGQGQFSHGYSYGHGYSSMEGYGHSHFSHGGSYSAQIPTCGQAVAHNCPADWATSSGGFHCLHQLARQTSHTAYMKSGGACRPAKQGPFPFNDCQDQCRIGSPPLSK